MKFKIFLSVNLNFLVYSTSFSQNTEFKTPDFVPEKVKEYVVNKVFNKK